MQSAVEIGAHHIQTNKMLRDFFKLRKRLFVDSLGWDIPHNGTIEQDQYDHDESVYTIITNDAGRVVAGCRILPTTCDKNGWSYMIKDASLGKIPQISADIMQTPPCQWNQYEITRFTVEPDLEREERNKVLTYLAFSSYQTVADRGGEYAVALMSPFFIRWFNALGIAVSKLGPVVKNGGERYCVMGGMVEQRRYVATNPP